MIPWEVAGSKAGTKKIQVDQKVRSGHGTCREDTGQFAHILMGPFSEPHSNTETATERNNCETLEVGINGPTVQIILINSL